MSIYTTTISLTEKGECLMTKRYHYGTKFSSLGELGVAVMSKISMDRTVFIKACNSHSNREFDPTYEVAPAHHTVDAVLAATAFLDRCSPGFHMRVEVVKILFIKKPDGLMVRFEVVIADPAIRWSRPTEHIKWRAFCEKQLAGFDPTHASDWIARACAETLSKAFTEERQDRLCLQQFIDGIFSEA